MFPKDGALSQRFFFCIAVFLGFTEAQGISQCSCYTSIHVSSTKSRGTETTRREAMLEGMTKLLPYKAEKLPNGFIIDQSNSISGSYIEEPLYTFALYPICLAILIITQLAPDDVLLLAV